MSKICSILVFGDIFGRVGRNLVKKHLDEIIAKYSPDFIVGNSENMTDGKAASIEHIHEFKTLGFDVLTGGNHSLSRISETASELDSEDTIQIRPANYFEHPSYRIPGKGYRVVSKAGKKLLVINIMANTYMRDEVFNPFIAIDSILGELGIPLHPENNLEATIAQAGFDAVLVDFHRETTAEMYCMAEYLSGRASFVYGTHTHVQTNDEHILSSGTGMICDVGMTGPLHSSIGQDFASRIPAFATGVNIFGPRPESVSSGDGSLHAVLVTLEMGKCVNIEKIRIRDLV